MGVIHFLFLGLSSLVMVSAQADVLTTQSKLKNIFDGGIAADFNEFVPASGWNCTTYPVRKTRNPEMFYRVRNRPLSVFDASDAIRVVHYTVGDKDQTLAIVQTNIGRSRRVSAYSLCAESPNSPVFINDGYSDAPPETQTFDFEPDLVEGKGQGPDAEYIESRRRASFPSLIRVRENFDHEVMESVKALPY